MKLNKRVSNFPLKFGKDGIYYIVQGCIQDFYKYIYIFYFGRKLIEMKGCTTCAGCTKPY